MINSKYLLLCLLASMPFYLSATTVEGTVHSLIDNADDLMGKDSDYVLLNGVTNVGTCNKALGLVVIRIPEADSQAFSMALAAQMANKKLIIDINDSRKDSGGSCIMRWLKIKN